MNGKAIPPNRIRCIETRMPETDATCLLHVFSIVYVIVQDKLIYILN